jgi:ribosomal protein S12 methylthiotransferase
MKSRGPCLSARVFFVDQEHIMNFYLVTLGCPKNEVDSEMMAELLIEAGHHPVELPDEADLLIANTCGFIGDAREESYDVLQELATLKRPHQSLMAAGCLTQRDCDAVCRRVPEVDAVIGTRNWPEIVSVVEGLAPQRQSAYRAIREQGNLIASVRRRTPRGQTAYIKIADGCDAGCAFCAIPLIKGPQASKPLDTILREAHELIEQGTRELVLIAQDTTAYGRDLGINDGLPILLQRLAEITPEPNWIRILYAYPQHISDNLIATMAVLPQVCHYLDLPLQHGHPEMLRRMRRPHDLDMVYDRITTLRNAMPDIALRSTFIVGFPGETEPEYEALLAFMHEIAFDHVGVFSYSRERGTPAAEMPDRVPQRIIAERHEEAMLTQQAISHQRNREQIGRVLPMLIEGVGEGLTVARSYRDAPEIDGMVLIQGEHQQAGFVDVRIVDAQPYDLVGELVEQPGRPRC